MAAIKRPVMADAIAIKGVAINSCPVGRRRRWGSMQPLPDLMMFASKLNAKAGLVNVYCAIMSLSFTSRSAKRREQVWENLHVSPRTAPSKGAKLCTYHHWFGRPSNLRFEPYYELPMGIGKLRALVQFRLGFHTLPISRAVLPDQPSRATFVHRLQYTSCGRRCSIACLMALISVILGPNFLAKMLRGACACSCDTRTRSLSAIVSFPCCRRLRHEHNPVLISQAG